MNLPNKLTLARFLLVPVFMFFVEARMIISGDAFAGAGGAEYSMLIALIIFMIASATDYLDGHIARKNNMVTDFGKFMDPLADKVLTTAAIIYLVKFDLCSTVVLILILAREFAVSGIRMIAASGSGGKVIAASIWGKAKTVMQMITIIAAFLFLALSDMGVAAAVDNAAAIHTVINAAMWVVAAATVISGMQYIIPNLDLIKNAK